MSNAIFKWVHISDIHYQPYGEGFNSSELREKLITCLKSIQGVDLLILTGDFRYAPKKLTDPAPVISQIDSMLEALGLPREKLVTCPGNHDLKRDKLRQSAIKSIINDYTPDMGIIDSDYLNYLNKGFSFYNDMINRLGFQWTMPNDNIPHKFIEFENVSFLLINTSLLAGTDEDDGKLILGTDYIRSLVKRHKDCHKPIIAAGHHGLDFLDKNEAKTIRKYFVENGIRLYLCGHSHKLYASNQDGLHQITTGCMLQTDNTVDAAFYVGELSNDGSVSLTSYKWDKDNQNWIIYEPNSIVVRSLYESEIETKVDLPSDSSLPEMTKHPFFLKGYSLLGALGIEGIKYVWSGKLGNIESLAFNQRLRRYTTEEDVNSTSAYTISVSKGCQLSTFDSACLFCESGKKSYVGSLSADDIALQCIFMASYDSQCPSYPHLRNNKREFAFMGQGEPGLMYPTIRRAIQITDQAMAKIGQQVSRYIISSCGLPDFVYALADDVKHGVFKNRVTIHFSLHAVEPDRCDIMPIDRHYPYREFIDACKYYYSITHEKTGVGILMFKGYKHSERKPNYSLTQNRLNNILSELDNNVFKIDLCTPNTTTGMHHKSISNNDAQKLLGIARSNGFECKIFSSFGENIHSGCGMLGIDEIALEDPGNNTIINFNKAIELLNEAKSDLSQIIGC